jgi:acetyl esterase
MDTASYRDNGEGYMLTAEGMQWFWSHYCPSDARSDPYASPLQAADLSGLPPALVLTAEFDPLRDEGEAYARRLQDAGVATELHRLDGLIHGFFSQVRMIPAGRAGIELAVQGLRAAQVR